MSRITDVQHTLTAHTVESLYQNPKNFICDECGASFNQESILTMHKLTHSSNEEPYGCEVCLKKFMYESSLKHHTKMGTVCGSKLQSKTIVKCDTKTKDKRLPLAATQRQSKQKNGVK